MSAGIHPQETKTKFFRSVRPLHLRCGETLDEFTLAYETYGELNAAMDNAILLFHALTGSQNAAGFTESVEGVGERWTEECQIGWWDGFIGEGKALDTSKYFIVCANYLGGCYGSTGPTTPDPETGIPYGSRFPRIAIADIVDSQVQLLDYLGITELRAAVGASVGGMLALSLATRYTERVDSVIAIGSGMSTPPLQRIQNFEQVCAIESDIHFLGGDYYESTPPSQGLALARMISHKTFVSLSALERRARDEIRQPEDDPSFSWYEINRSLESYMLHQGRKFVKRFDANTYLRVIDAWQRFDLVSEAKAKSMEDLFSRCRDQRYLIFSIDSDVCFYPDQQAQMARMLSANGVPNMHITVHSSKGHDAFLTEPELFTPHLVYALEK
ncbi:MAG: homoserine O-acetyltransferase [Verrucomicrobiae bacterium]|nr:homoserine O-acetyltransferase [Verrucomicrobiae bacterium]